MLKKKKAKQTVKWRTRNQQWAWRLDSSERISNFSLKIRAIRPSTVFGTRREAALHGEGFAWVPDLGIFLKLREVGVSPYLGFIPALSALQMFESNEAVRAVRSVPNLGTELI